MKIKLKGVYENKVEPTTLLEVDPDDAQELKSKIDSCLEEILSGGELMGLFVSRDKN